MASTEVEAEAEQVDEQAKEWLEASYHFLPDAQVFRDRDMVTAYRAGFAAGLGHARKVFMAPSDAA